MLDAEIEIKGDPPLDLDDWAKMATDPEIYESDDADDDNDDDVDDDDGGGGGGGGDYDDADGEHDDDVPRRR